MRWGGCGLNGGQTASGAARNLSAMHPSHPRSRPVPALRGFAPDVYGLATLFLFVLLGQSVLLLVFWDSEWTLEFLVALGVFDDEIFRVFQFMNAVSYTSNYVLGFTVGIALFGVPGRKFAALAPVLMICSPFLNFLLAEPMIEALGPSVPFGQTLTWAALYGVFYALALAGWAYGFGRSVAGVMFAAIVGFVSLAAYTLLLFEWGYAWVDGLDINDIAMRFVFAGCEFGYLVIMVAVLALSCAVGPGHARKPVAPASGYGQGPAGPPVMHSAGRYARGPAGPAGPVGTGGPVGPVGPTAPAAPAAPPVMPPAGRGQWLPQTGISQTGVSQTGVSHTEVSQPEGSWGEWPGPRESRPPAGKKTHWP